MTSLILANVTIDYRRQISFGERLRIDTWVEALGRSSITLGQTIWANDERAADVRSVAVHFDYKTGKPIELTEAIRTVLEPMIKVTSARGHRHQPPGVGTKYFPAVGRT